MQIFNGALRARPSRAGPASRGRGRPQSQDFSASTSARPASASRPISMGSSIRSRLVSVTSTGQLRPPSRSRVRMTKRSSASPLELRTDRRSAIGASCHGTLSASPATSKRTHGAPSASNGSIELACSDEVRAPVSIFAATRAIPRSGKPTHSRQPTTSACPSCLVGMSEKAARRRSPVSRILGSGIASVSRSSSDRHGVDVACRAGKSSAAAAARVTRGPAAPSARRLRKSCR